MSQRRAVRLPHRAIEALGPLRRLPSLEACAAEDALWLRGEGEDAFWKQLRILPEALLFEVLPDGQLIRCGQRVPCGRLPEETWLPLSRWLAITVEPAALPGQIADRVALRVVPSTDEREANVLLTSLQDWTAYAVTAPQVRLQRWTFACSSIHRFAPSRETINQSASAPNNVPGSPLVVVRGTPLPPLPGQRYCESEGVAVQAGHAWEPAVDAAVLCGLLGLHRGDLALLHADGSWDHVKAADFTAASRSAVRLSSGGADVT